jgi:hypothetical protein
MELLDFKSMFISELESRANANSTNVKEEFFNKALEFLESSETVVSPNIYFIEKTLSKSKKTTFSGFTIDDADSSISFLINDYQTINSENFTNTRSKDLSQGILNFMDEVIDGNIEKFFDDSDDILSFASTLRYRFISESDDQINKLRVIIITNSEISKQFKSRETGNYRGKSFEIIVWTIETFFELIKSKTGKVPIEIEIENYGVKGLPCLKAEVSDQQDFETYLAVVPGDFLARIYLNYGSRLLEGNVRAFLSFKGKINKGIKQTINNEPERFFPYNNGISTTADSVVIEKTANGLVIKKIRDLQIINGGQTTASIASVKFNDKKDLGGIFIQMKLTVIKNREKYDELVQDIAKYANSQNKVSDADFFSNHPFHRTFEDLSNKVVTQPNKNGVTTYWFYERSRGKYQQEQMKMTKAQVNNWQKRYPSNQVVTKEQLAKYINTINCRPDIVSGGLQNSFKFFARIIGEKQDYDSIKYKINEVYFKKAIASAIIFKETDKIIQNAKWYVQGGYKANIITYSIAKLVSSLPIDKDIDYLTIWKNQEIPLEMKQELQNIAELTNKFITDSNGVIVTEYCKKNETWEKFRDAKIQISQNFIKILVSKDKLEKESLKVEEEVKEENLLNLEIQIINLGHEFWERLKVEADKLKILNETERSIVNLVLANKVPSRKQAKILWDLKTKIEKEGIKV